MTQKRAAAPRKPATRPSAAASAGARRSEFASTVLSVVRRIPRGRVVSYGGVAAMAGRPRAARAVGSVMQALPDADAVPWWRVINAQGGISPGGTLHRAQIQRALLEGEGIHFDRAGRVDWERYGWKHRRSRAEQD